MELPPGYLSKYIVSPPPTVRQKVKYPSLPRRGSRPPPPLLPEIYALILPFLLQPLPLGGDEVADDTLRQPDLATAMRVNKLFYSIAAPILYHTIITTHLPSLIYNIDQPAASSGLKSKAELLSNTKALHLEYAYYREPTYLSLMLHDGDYFGLLVPTNVDMVRFCSAECGKIAAAAAKITSLPDRKLVRLSTGAFTSGQRFVWQMVTHATNLPQGGMGIVDNISSAQFALSKMVALSPHLESICQWAGWGPLSMGSSIFHPYDSGAIDPSTGRPSRTVQYCCHLEPSTGEIPIVIGGLSARWYVPFSSPTRDPGLVSGTETLLDSIGNQVYFREEGWRTGGEETMAKYSITPSVNVDIYLSGSMCSRSAKAYIEEKVAAFNKEMQANMRMPKARSEGNKWRIRRIQDAPPCEACGGVTTDGGIFGHP